MAVDLNSDALAKHFPVSEAIAHHVATVTGSVTDAATWQTLVRTAKEKFGGLDIVVNNAGTSYRNKATAEVTEEEFDKCFTVNVKSVFLSIPAAVPALEERGGGAIINIASIGAVRPRPGLVWYNASKGAVANVRPDPNPPAPGLYPFLLCGGSSAGGRERVHMSNVHICSR